MAVDEPTKSVMVDGPLKDALGGVLAVRAVHEHPDAPKYPRDISAYPNVIAHIGVGGFHRSHAAVYLHHLLQRDGLAAGWAICGVGWASRRADADMRDKLASQDYMYTVLSQGASGRQPSIVGSIMDFVLVGEDATAAIARLANQQVKIASLTITEKGYYVDHKTGGLDVANEQIIAELPPGAPPKTVWGLIYAAMKARARAGIGPITVLSCDNMPESGHVAQRMLLEFAQAKQAAGDDFGEEAYHLVSTGAVACPSMMVDRITPATTPSDIALLESDFGIKDAWPVVAEEFAQWVIEDHFPSGRPAWEKLGGAVLLVKGEDVKMYESMKLRMLNSSHSALAYVALLAGYTTVHEAMADPAIRGFVASYLDEVLPRVKKAPGVDLNHYRDRLIDRFSNVYIKDTLLRLAEDGSQKLQNTMKPVLVEKLEADEPFGVIALAIAGWICVMAGVDESGAPIAGLRDPAGGARLTTFASAAVASPAPAAVGEFLKEFFGEDVSRHEAAATAVAESLAALKANGAAKVLSPFAARCT